MALSKIEVPSLDVGQLGGRRNLIINGAMQVAQREVSGTTPQTDNYLIDRFSMSRFGGYPDNTTQSQTTDAPEGFYNSFKMLRTSAHTLTGTNATAFFQRLEGLNTSHLKWGTALAKPVVVSFWVKSNQTGQFPLILADSGNAVDIGKLYEINSANTWEYKTIAIEAPTAGTFDTDTTTGMVVYWGFGSTSSTRTAQGTTWGSSNSSGSSKAMVTGASTALATTNGATWQITGVQLEVDHSGTGQASPFEHESYGTTLQKCQRYAIMYSGYDAGRGGIVASGTRGFFGFGSAHNANNPVTFLSLPVVMRAPPSVSYSSAGHFAFDNGYGGFAVYSNLQTQDFRANPQGIALIGTTSGLSNGMAGSLSTNNSTGWILLDAEL